MTGASGSSMAIRISGSRMCIVVLSAHQRAGVSPPLCQSNDKRSEQPNRKIFAAKA